MFLEVLCQCLVNIGSLESGAQVREEMEGGRKITTNAFHNTKLQTKVIPNDRKWLITLILSGLQEKQCYLFTGKR